MRRERCCDGFRILVVVGPVESGDELDDPGFIDGKRGIQSSSRHIVWFYPFGKD